MIRLLSALSCAALLAACDNQQPLAFTLGEEPEPPVVPVDEEGKPIPFLENGIPELVGGNLTAATFNKGSNLLTVRIESLDSTPLQATYERNAALDVPGYVAFSQQEDPLDRFFIGMAQTSNDGATTGILVMDGGQFRTFFAGVNYAQTGPYSAHVASQPDNGLVSYAGTYVGMLNGDADRPNQTLPIPSGVSPDIYPGQPLRVTGDVFVNADFVDMSVNGSVFNRRIVDTATGITTPGGAIPGGGLPSVFLVPTDVNATGDFLGKVEDNERNEIGDYAGTFGGVQASGLAVGVHLEGDFIPVIESEIEYGLFVLNKCGTPGDGALCSVVNP